MRGAGANRPSIGAEWSKLPQRPSHGVAQIAPVEGPGGANRHNPLARGTPAGVRLSRCFLGELRKKRPRLSHLGCWHGVCSCFIACEGGCCTSRMSALGTEQQPPLRHAPSESQEMANGIPEIACVRSAGNLPASDQRKASLTRRLRGQAAALKRRPSSSVLVGFVALAMLAFVEGAQQAECGTITFTASNSGSDLVLSWSGSWDLTGYSAPGLGTGSANFSQIGENPPGTFNVESYGSTATGDQRTLTSSATLSSILASGDSGTVVGNLGLLRLDYDGTTMSILVPSGYVSGNSLSGTANFSNRSISSVFGTNLDSGPVTALSIGNNSVVFQSVPEPSTYAMLIAGGLAAGAGAIRRRRRA